MLLALQRSQEALGGLSGDVHPEDLRIELHSLRACLGDADPTAAASRLDRPAEADGRLGIVVALEESLPAHVLELDAELGVREQFSLATQAGALGKAMRRSRELQVLRERALEGAS